jgi:prepilin-type N-terminal cleavage/methylation domain-containing protein
MKKGFTLIELMIVVAIIAIIAAIAIPSLLRSRMATNATAAAAALKALIEAQEIYHRTDYNTNGVLEYTSNMGNITTAPSLYSQAAEGDIALIDRAFKEAECGVNQAVTANGATPKAGYVFCVLTAQGANAPGGAKVWTNATNLLVYAHGGCASPAQYDNTGRDTFIISAAGTIYQKDLLVGPSATTQATFNPDTLWVPSE